MPMVQDSMQYNLCSKVHVSEFSNQIKQTFFNYFITPIFVSIKENLLT